MPSTVPSHVESYWPSLSARIEPIRWASFWRNWHDAGALHKVVRWLRFATLPVTVSQEQQRRAITLPQSLSPSPEFVTSYADPVQQMLLNDMLLEF